jgi:hypothetical protein
LLFSVLGAVKKYKYTVMTHEGGGCLLVLLQNLSWIRIERWDTLCKTQWLLWVIRHRARNNWYFSTRTSFWGPFLSCFVTEKILCTPCQCDRYSSSDFPQLNHYEGTCNTKNYTTIIEIFEQHKSALDKSYDVNLSRVVCYQSEHSSEVIGHGKSRCRLRCLRRKIEEFEWTCQVFLSRALKHSFYLRQF